ncbi:MAG: hypothetical protein JW908_15935 [Anaerolineales bacterium]|nr:hypothetical protein [Anaerolineales bacterium]
MSKKISLRTTIIVALLGLSGIICLVVCLAMIGFGLLYTKKTATVLSLTSTPIPTNTPMPTSTSVPTNTPMPTGTPVPTITPVPTKSSFDFLESIPSYIQSMRFYENDAQLTPYDQRVYAITFNSTIARYIKWELKLDHRQPGQRIDFIIHSVYYKADGSIFFEEDSDHFVESDWTSSTQSRGVGWDEAGNWEKGKYTVVLYINNIEIARESFLIQ